MLVSVSNTWRGLHISGNSSKIRGRHCKQNGLLHPRIVPRRARCCSPSLSQPDDREIIVGFIPPQSLMPTGDATRSGSALFADQDQAHLQQRQGAATTPPDTSSALSHPQRRPRRGTAVGPTPDGPLPPLHACRHFVNLTNGIEAISALRDLGLEFRQVWDQSVGSLMPPSNAGRDLGDSEIGTRFLTNMCFSLQMRVD